MYLLDDARHKFRLSLEHNDVDEYIIGNEEPIVWHEQILDRSWDELKAANDRRKKEIVGIQIKNVEMKKSFLMEASIIQVQDSILTMQTFVERASYIYQIWLKPVSNCGALAFATIGLIAWNRHDAFLGH